MSKIKSVKFYIITIAIMFLVFIILLLNTIIPKFKSSKNLSKADEQFKLFEDTLFIDAMNSSPINCHFSIINKNNYNLKPSNKLTNNSTINDKEKTLYLSNNIKKLQQIHFTELSDSNKLDYTILNTYLADSLKMSQYSIFDEPLSPNSGENVQLPIVLCEYKLNGDSDIDSYFSILNSIPDYFKEIIKFEKDKASRKIFMNDDNLSEVISQCQMFINNPPRNILITSFNTKITDYTGSLKHPRSYYKSLNQKLVLTKVIPAYNYIIEELTKLKGSCENKTGLCGYENGKDYYTNLVRLYTGSSMTISNMLYTIKSNLISYLKEAKSLIGENNIPVFSPILNNNIISNASNQEKANVINTSQNILYNLKKECETNFPVIKNIDLKIKTVNPSIEKYSSPAFYMIPPLDCIKESKNKPVLNTIYINSFNTSQSQLYTTLAHEGYPGHLLQTMYFLNTNPNPMRLTMSFDGYVEGWATFVEYLSYNFNSYKAYNKDNGKLSRLNSQFSLGISSLIDIGVNYSGWTKEDTRNVLSSYGIDDSIVSDKMFNYVCANPGIYLKYYIGYIEFNNLYTSSKEKLGSNFSFKTFIENVLKTGPCQFSVLRKQLNID